jgi:spermidine/putrescine transport system permease protein
MTSGHRGIRWLQRCTLGLVLLGMYAPVAMVFLYSFNESRLGAVWTRFSTRWYAELFRRADLWVALKTSLLIGLTVSTLSSVLGTVAAIGLQRWGKRTRRLAEGVLALPLVMPDVILGVSLAILYHWLGMTQGRLTVILAHGVFGVSYAFVVIYAAVEQFDATLLAAALDCGATPWQAHWRVTVPILLPSIVVAWLFVLALSFDDFLITFFTKGPGNDTLPIKIFSQMRFGVRPDTNALFVLLFLAALAGMVLAGSLVLLRRRLLSQRSNS